jgi:hypothetical protein
VPSALHPFHILNLSDPHSLVILLEAAPTAFANIGFKFWIILICLTVIYGVLVYFFLPEVRRGGSKADRPTNANTC